MSELYSKPDQYTPFPNDMFRQMEIVEQLVMPESQVSIEGPPLYVGQDWSPQHSYGYHHVMPWIKELLSRLGCQSTHIALLDDYSGETGQDVSLLENILNPPQRLYFESEFAEQAAGFLKTMQTNGHVINIAGQSSLDHGSAVPLLTPSGRPTCELLDACFQLQKLGDSAIVTHPIEFKRQQAGMRAVLQTINEGELPFEIINIFTKNQTINRIDHTNVRGETDWVFGKSERRRK